MTRRNYPLYQVRPRYTPGSPAQVNEESALRVAEEERDSFEAHAEGFMGEEWQQKAERLGLQRIAYYIQEKGGHWVLLVDLITEERIEGRHEVELELAAIGTRRIPPKIEKNLNRWGMLKMFEEADLIGRRDLLRHSDDMDWIHEHVLRMGGVRG